MKTKLIFSIISVMVLFSCGERKSPLSVDDTKDTTLFVNAAKNKQLTYKTIDGHIGTFRGVVTSDSIIYGTEKGTNNLTEIPLDSVLMIIDTVITDNQGHVFNLSITPKSLYGLMVDRLKDNEECIIFN